MGRGGGWVKGGYPENVCRNDEAFLRQEAVMGKEGRGFDSRTVTPRLKCVNQKWPPVLPDLTRPNSKKGSPLKRSRAYFRHHQGSLRSVYCILKTSLTSVFYGKTRQVVGYMCVCVFDNNALERAHTPKHTVYIVHRVR